MVDRFQILSLDGGGIRGLFSASILAALESDLGITIRDHFDLIVGTSTGGIIALALGLGLSPDAVVDLYFDQGKKILSNRLGWRTLRQGLRSKYSARALEHALRNDAVFGNRLLGDSTKPLVIPSYSLESDDVYLFKTDHSRRLRRDWKVPAWQVALATCAAPTYFPASSHIGCLRHVDGGLWANNPILVGLSEAVSIFNRRLDEIRVFSLGTTKSVSPRKERLDGGGALQWLCESKNLFLRGQSLSATNLAIHMLGQSNVLRVDPEVPQRSFGFDKISRRSALKARALHESRKIAPAFECMFADHIAVAREVCRESQPQDARKGVQT